MNATFRQLRLFLAVAETGSVSAAARKLHVTQPTVSMQLRELASAVGLPLYEVVARKLYLTSAGDELARSARVMADEWSAFAQRIDAMKGLTRGRLRIAVVSTAKYFMPRLLGAFCARHPDVDIALEVLNRDGVIARLRENRDDLYVMSQPPPDLDVEQRVFMSNPLVVVAPRAHRLARRKPVPLADLGTENFILRERGSGTRMACDAHFGKLRFKARVRLELGSNEAIKQAVAGGLGLAVLSAHAIGAHPEVDGVCVLPVRDFPIQSGWHIVYPRGKRLSPIAAEFRDHLSRHAAGAMA
jgi:DNA-binding transcriptional LysR family regulator